METKETDMVLAAAQRLPVWVFSHGTVHRATLIAWNPRRKDGRRRNGYAIVEFRSKRRAAVRQNMVTLAVDDAS